MGKSSEKFEETILNFLKRSGFKDVRGGRTFRIKGIQIDAIGGYGDTVFVIECYAAKSSTRSIREKIKSFRGVIPDISRGLRRHKTYKKYKNHLFVLALKNIIPKKRDLTFAINSKYKIIIWDKDFLLYYFKLSKVLEKYTIYQILGELGIFPIKRKFKVRSFKVELANNIYAYSFWVNPKDLLEYTYVARRERKEEYYYQRFIDKNRIKKMAEEFIDTGGFYPNSIIVSINEDCSFKEIDRWKISSSRKSPIISYGILEFPVKFRSIWIIDGQHRLYSFINSDKTHPIAVIAFENLEKIKQANIFLDVNLNQKPVQPDLLWDLIGDIVDINNSMSQIEIERCIISNVVKQLNKKGVLKGKIYIPSHGPEKKGKLKFSGICQAIERAKLVKEYLVGKGLDKTKRKKNPIYNNNSERLLDNLAKVLNKYFKAVDEVFDRNWKREFIYTNGGIAVMIYYLERILWTLEKIPSSAELKNYLKPLSQYLMDAYQDSGSKKELRLACNSEGGRANKLSEFVVHVSEMIDDKNFSSGLVTPLHELDRKIEVLEANLRSYIKSKMEQLSPKWIDKYVPVDIKKRLEDRLKKKASKDMRSELWEFMTLGESKEIIIKNWNFFENDFNQEFDSKSEFESYLNKINKIRSPLSHGGGKKLNLKKRDFDLINIYIEKIQSCIKK